MLIGWARIRKRYIELAAPEVIASAAAKITEQARERAAQVEAKLNRCKFGSQLRCKLVTCCQPAQAGFERWSVRAATAVWAPGAARGGDGNGE